MAMHLHTVAMVHDIVQVCTPSQHSRPSQAEFRAAKTSSISSKITSKSDVSVHVFVTHSQAP